MASQIPPWLSDILGATVPPPYTAPPPGNQYNMATDPAEPMPTSVNYEPDYMALIENDPAYAALKESISAQDIGSAAQRQAATQQALIQFGMVPDFASLASSLGLSPEAVQMLMQDVDPNAAALAQQNTASGLSTEAQLQRGQQTALLSLRNQLAARGALSSGENAYRTNTQNQSYAQQQQSALSSLLASIGGYQSQYLDAHNRGQDKLNEGLRAALEFESSLPQNQGFHLQYDSKTGTYKDGSGNQYAISVNPDGTWTLTGTAGAYTLDAFGKLTAGAYKPPDQPASVTPDPNANTVPIPPVQPPVQNPPPGGGPYQGPFDPGHRPPPGPYQGPFDPGHNPVPPPQGGGQPPHLPPPVNQPPMGMLGRNVAPLGAPLGAAPMRLPSQDARYDPDPWTPPAFSFGGGNPARGRSPYLPGRKRKLPTPAI